MRKIFGTVALLAVLAGCGSSPEPVSDEQLKSELAAVGVEARVSMSEWREVMRRTVCEGSEDAYELSLTFEGVDEAMLDANRVAAKHFCPERLPVIDRVDAARD